MHRNVQSCRTHVSSNRRGFTMVELLISVTTLVGLSILVMTVIALLITAEQSSTETLFVEQTIANLADDLRQDAHQSRSLQTDNEAGLDRVDIITLFHNDGHRIIYECTANSVERTSMDGKDITSTEDYRLPFGTSWFTVVDERLVSWHHDRLRPAVGGLSQPDAADVSARDTYQVDAALGIGLADEEGE